MIELVGRHWLSPSRKMVAQNRFYWSSPAPINPFLSNCQVARIIIYCKLKNRFFHIGLLLFLCLSTNIIGLSFTGMENSIELTFSVLLILGLIKQECAGLAPKWIWAVIIITPLVRYETLALSLVALFYLLGKRYYFYSIASGFILCALITCFSLFLFSNGNGWLPSSVYVKSSGINIMDNLFLPEGQPFLLSLGFLLGGIILKRRTKESILGTYILLASTGHLVFGKFGSFYRYEIYMLVSLILIIIFLYRRQLSRLGELPLPFSLFFFTILIFIFRVYLNPLSVNPIATNNIYEQQYQMGKFVREFYKEPVAVNDIGLVSYNNPNYVLDFFGQASHDALYLRINQPDNLWMDNLAIKHDVKLIMIYPYIYKSVPQSWEIIGQLILSKENISVGGSVVNFYAINHKECPKIQNELKLFKASIPDNILLSVFNCE